MTNATSNSNSIRAAATDMLARGLKIIICKHNSKAPHPTYSPNAVNSATDKAEILLAFDKEPLTHQPNYGIAAGLSNLTILDADHGLKNADEFETWKKENHIPETFTIRTGRRKNKVTGEPEFGVQMYFAGNTPTCGFDIAGVTGEFKSNGGYVIGAGSVHPDSGEQYEVYKDMDFTPLPESVRAHGKKPSTSAKPIIIKTGDAFVPEGERWITLQSKAGSLRNCGLSEQGIYDALKDFAAHRCKNGENYPDEKITELAHAAVTKFEETGTQPSGTSLVITRGDAVTRKELKYISFPYLPAKLCGLAGNSGEAKSPLTRDITACITRGLNFPNRTENPLGARSVIMLNAEDDLADTIMPSLDAMGADDSKFYYIHATKVINKGDAVERSFAFDKDMQILREYAKTLPDLGLIIIDPITNYLGDKMMNAEDEMRSILMPISEMANELEICAITIHHFNSREKGTTPLHRIMGAKALHGVARFIYLVGANTTDDVIDKHSHIFTQARGSTDSVPSLKYHTEQDVKVTPEGTLKSIKIVWDGQVDVTAADAVDAVTSAEKSTIEEYGQVINAFLQTGAKTAAECFLKLSDAGWGGNAQTSTTAIKKKAKCKSEKIDGKHCWVLIPQVKVGKENL
jgi:hypothetical protein